MPAYCRIYNMYFNDMTLVPPYETHTIGIDERSAFLVNRTTGLATLVGFGSAYICHKYLYPQTCKANTPLTFQNISCIQLNATLKDTYSFATMKSAKGAYYINNITNGIADISKIYGPREPNPVINDDDAYL